MDYNELRRKYSDNRQEAAEIFPVEPEAVYEDVPENEEASFWLYPEAGTAPAADTTSEDLVPVTVNKPVEAEEPDGFFSGNGQQFSYAEKRTRRTVRHFPPQWMRNVSVGNLAAVPWVDVIMILLTIAGVVWVIANFDAVTLRIAAVIAKLVQSVILLVLIVAVIAGLVLIGYSRRRRRVW